MNAPVPCLLPRPFRPLSLLPLFPLVLLAGAAQAATISLSTTGATIPGFEITYQGRLRDINGQSSTVFNPEPGGVLAADWQQDYAGDWYVGRSTGGSSVELGRMRAREDSSIRLILGSGHMSTGVGGRTQEVSFKDEIRLNGIGLNANSVLRVDYHFGGQAGGRIETNVDQGGQGEYDLLAKLSMQVGPNAMSAVHHTWGDETIFGGGQTLTHSATSGIFDVSNTGFSLRLGPRSIFGGFELPVLWQLQLTSSCWVSMGAVDPQVPATAGGCIYSADYSKTASAMGLSLYDGDSGALIDPAQYTLVSDSGFDYGRGFAVSPVPEGPTAWLMLAGLGLLATRGRRTACTRLQQ